MKLKECKSGVPTTCGGNPPASGKNKSSPHREAGSLRSDGPIIPKASSMPILNGMRIIRTNRPVRSSCQLELAFFFLKIILILKFIYLALLSLSCGMWDLHCDRWTPERAGSLSSCGA